MIRDPIAESVSLLANQLADKDIELQPVAGTYMDAILNSTSVTSTKERIVDSENVAWAVVDITRSADESVNRAHQKAIAAAAKALMEDSVQIIDKCKNTIYPLMEDLYQRAADTVKTRSMDGVRQYKVVSYCPAEILFNGYMVDIMTQNAYRHNAWSFNNEFKTYKMFPARSIEELMIICRTDNPVVNNLLDEAIAKYGDSEVQCAYNIFFNIDATVADIGTTRLPQNPMDLRSDKLYEGVRLFGVLLAMGMMKDPPSINMSLDSLNAYLTDVMQFCASSLKRFMDNYERDSKKHYLNLFRHYVSPQLTELRVNDQSYKYWKDKGLSDEAIKGAVLSDGVRDAERIMESEEKYIGIWKREERVKQRTIENNTVYAMQTGLIETVLNYARRLYGETYMAKVRSLEIATKQVIDDVNPIKDTDLYPLVKETVLRIFYPSTAYRAFITSMDHITEDSPSIDPRQAAGLAFIDMAVEWLLSQCHVAKR